MIKYLKIKDNLYLAQQVVRPEQQKEQVVDLSTQHIFVIDCSGSMSGELSTIRKDLFNKISTILKPSDSVTIIWFSGRNQYGVILEDYTVHSNIALEKVRETINKYLTPQGLTAFKQPLEEVKAVIERVRSNNSNMLHSMFFLTDGYDNQFSTKEILKATTELTDYLNSATIVEYGWYCNRELLSQMAQEIGGVHTFSQNFQDYEPYLTKQFTSDNRGKRTYIELANAPKFDMVFNVVDGDVVMYKTNENNEILINVNGDTNIFYFTDSSVVETGNYNVHNLEYIKEYFNNRIESEMIQGMYASLFAFSRKSDYGMVSEILKALGDAYFITEKANTFGTQKINELEAKFLDAVNDSSKRYIDGYNPNLEPAEDAYCVLDMMQDLMTQDGNYWYPQHEAFNYKRIGSKTIAKMTDLSEEDRQKIDDLLDSKKLDEAQQLLEEIKKNQPTQLKFHYFGTLQASPFYDLVWNETRANLSVQVNYKGHVELPENQFGLPVQFPTNQFRNYTLIKDGIVYNYTLPVSLGRETFDKLQANGLLDGEFYEENKIYVLDFSKLPVINRKMVSTLSAKELFTNEWELLKLKSSNAVYNYYKKLKFQNTSKGFVEQFGKEATEWLATFGLKDYGFNPPKTVEKQGEQIDVNVLEVKIDKMSTTPGKKEIESAERKINASESLTPKEALVENAIKEVNQFTGLIKEVTNQDKMLEDWLYQKSKFFRTEKNRLMSEISKAKFLTIVGKSWFTEFADRSQNEMTLNLDSQDVKFKVEDKIETITI
jgi:uncharacterized protein YegL